MKNELVNGRSLHLDMALSLNHWNELVIEEVNCKIAESRT